ncbi:hypothetical protein [Flavihumibacter fluvii]|uniref:hypothetical protein n=1 Tax=Flavihumibacter fluvii TaxID=2838157 RepID=UPI001BDEDF19|nr:hypothetical protein [Flavihumibacter fluvii]ULQ52204.1 hypothetical protein KJS93_19120 [Flavihumibacter fluvii]
MQKLIGCLIVAFLFQGKVFSQEKLVSSGEIPILAWYSIPAAETSLARYQEMKEAGISFQVNNYSNIEELLKAMDIASKAGIRIVASCPELKSDPEGTVRRLMKHPALAGYHLMDEPGLSAFAELGNWARKIQSIDNKHFCYVNLFPNFADSSQLGTKSYLEYVHESIKHIPVSFLSFDYYPVLKDRLSLSWYENLEQISQAATRAGKPFWAFALTTNYDEDHLTPQTLAAIRLQVYSDLAYGAQGIQYFTYWSATSLNAPSSEDQRGAPISAAGKRTVVYDRVKAMSGEIKALSGVFLGSKPVWVRHMGRGRIPNGTIRLTALPQGIKVLETAGAPALVSLLEKGDNYYLIIVNKDFLKSMDLTLYGDDSLQKILKDGTIVPASAYEPSMEVDPGDAAIYRIPKTK